MSSVFIFLSSTFKDINFFLLQFLNVLPDILSTASVIGIGTEF